MDIVGFVIYLQDLSQNFDFKRTILSFRQTAISLICFKISMWVLNPGEHGKCGNFGTFLLKFTPI